MVAAQITSNSHQSRAKFLSLIHQYRLSLSTFPSTKGWIKCLHTVLSHAVISSCLVPLTWTKVSELRQRLFTLLNSRRMFPVTPRLTRTHRKPSLHPTNSVPLTLSCQTPISLGQFTVTASVHYFTSVTRNLTALSTTALFPFCTHLLSCSPFDLISFFF